jgi:hypothetical protein
MFGIAIPVFRDVRIEIAFNGKKFKKIYSIFRFFPPFWYRNLSLRRGEYMRREKDRRDEGEMGGRVEQGRRGDRGEGREVYHPKEKQIFGGQFQGKGRSKPGQLCRGGKT